MPISELLADDLKASYKLGVLKCESTAELTPLEGIIGQDRALRALKLGFEIQAKGFNLYVAGQTGTGKTTAVKNFLAELAKTRPIPLDWVYINNFKNPYEPLAIQLPTGMRKRFQSDIGNFIEEAKKSVPRAFQNKD